MTWLVADIGGTNARFALVDGPGAQPGLIEVLAVAEHATLNDAMAAYLDGKGVTVSAAAVAVAGPVGGSDYALTNAHWRGSIHDLAVPYAGLINDFEALAMSLPYLAGDDLAHLGGPLPAHGVKAVLGPGTGLGVAGLVPVGGGWAPVPCEGGHVTAPVTDAREAEIVKALFAQGMARVEAEDLLSGSGLPRLHRALALVNGVTSPQLSAADIVARLDDSLCAETVEVFCGMLGSFAGNVALTLGARGGVYLGGGVLPRIVERVRASEFRARFEAGPTAYLAPIATSLIVAAQPGLTGAAAWLSNELGRERNVHEPA